MKLFEITTAEIQKVISARLLLFTLAASGEDGTMWIEQSDISDLTYMAEEGDSIASQIIKPENLAKEMEEIYDYAGGNDPARDEKDKVVLKKQMARFTKRIQQKRPSFFISWGIEYDYEITAVYTDLDIESIDAIAGVMRKIEWDSLDPNDIEMTKKYFKIKGKKYYYN